ncbi:MFS transporter [Bradyrhizobium sp. BTAi1]|uniref:MFS transporter n=1 Tax=Bradyrhizobium sp. (strain BTAi1 / ATCC BAA-1182) TaxID=288000 RepID=UPI00005DFCF7|nr:MFS transporter [Bradyrhizobium sp. BTAi1]ABQ32910.1 Putative Major Facilitator Superfamily (MFS) transporter [Bradyrhizobium sp. BTAi1]
MISDRNILTALAVLAITQVIGWGTLSLPAVLGRDMAVDLGLSLSAVFAGNSVLYVAIGLCSPLLARSFARHGGRRVMMVGTLVAAAGFTMLSAARGPISYYIAWLGLGVAGSATLSTAAYVVLNEVAGPGARRAIGALMLVTGLSSSIFWPVSAVIAAQLGWRGTCLVYAALLLLVSLPLLAALLPKRRNEQPTLASDAGSAMARPEPSQGTFYLLTAAIALNAFVTMGLSAVLIELLKVEGLTALEAIGFGSMLGVIQISARALDLLGGGRWDAITTALAAGLALPLAMLLLMVWGGSAGAVAVFIVVYGLGSGALAVARATMPLVFYDGAAFAKASAQIALPLNLLSATAAPVMAALLTSFGSNTLLSLTLICSSAALLMLLLLRLLRPAVAASA